MNRLANGWQWWALWALVAALYLAVAMGHGLEAGSDGLIRDGICRQMLANQTAGRQGLVSSVWWGPVSTLSVLPGAFVMRDDAAGLGPVATSAWFGAGVLLLLERALRRRGAGAWRLVLVAAVGLDPSFVHECTTGTAAPLAIALIVAATDALVGWLEARRLRDLVAAGLALALLVATGFDVWGWVAAGILVLAVAELRRRRERGERRAVLILGLLPLVYVLGLWLLLCWLIMGDPFYLVRSLADSGPGPGRGFALPGPLAAWYGALMALAVGNALMAVARRRRGEVALALLVLALPATAGLMAGRGWLWTPAPLLSALPALLAFSLGRTLVGRQGGGLTGWAIGAAAVAACLVLAVRLPPGRQAAATGAPAYETAQGLQALERHVRERSPFAKVFVCGYDSFGLLRDNGSATFVHAMDFNFDKAKRDYYGHALFVLVRHPEQRYAMDSVHRKYPRVFIQGGPDTLYDSDWGDWRLFEMIQAPQTR